MTAYFCNVGDIFSGIEEEKGGSNGNFESIGNTAIENNPGRQFPILKSIVRACQRQAAFGVHEYLAPLNF